jgi:hypothetical protein
MTRSRPARPIAKSPVEVNEMKKLLLLLTLFLMACAVEQQTVVEAPTELPQTAETPATTESPTQPSTSTSSQTSTSTEVSATACYDDCLPDCQAQATEVCGQGTDWYGCLDNCYGKLHDEGCKASCNAEATEECEIIFKSECKRYCKKQCA